MLYWLSWESKKHLGIHSEMIADGVVDLFETGRYRLTHRRVSTKDKMVVTFLMGTKKLYDWCDKNPDGRAQRSRLCKPPYDSMQLKEPRMHQRMRTDRLHGTDSIRRVSVLQQYLRRRRSGRLHQRRMRWQKTEMQELS